MTRIITTNNDKQYQTRNFLVNAGASAVGGLTYIAAKEIGPQYVCKPLGKGVTSNTAKVDYAIINDALNKVLNTPKVAAKNFEIIDMSKLPQIERPFSEKYLYGNLKTQRNLTGFSEEILKQEKIVNDVCRASVPWYAKPFKPLKDFYADAIRYMFQEGKNACCLPVLKKIIANKQKIGASIFHEIGHGMNPKLNTAAVLLTHSTKYVAALAVLKRSKLEGEECKGKLDKTLNFAKKYAPVIGMATMLPLVGTEYLASHKGAKMVKPFVDKGTYKRIISLQRAGGMTYVALTLITGAAIYAGSKIRDFFGKPKRIIPNSRGEINERKNENDKRQTV